MATKTFGLGFVIVVDFARTNDAFRKQKVMQTGRGNLEIGEGAEKKMMEKL